METPRIHNRVRGVFYFENNLPEGIVYLENVFYLWVLLSGEPEAKINPKGMGKNL